MKYEFVIQEDTCGAISVVPENVEDLKILNEFIERIEERLTNVMGLPMELVRTVLAGLKRFAG